MLFKGFNLKSIVAVFVVLFFFFPFNKTIQVLNKFTKTFESNKINLNEKITETNKSLKKLFLFVFILSLFFSHNFFWIKFDEFKKNSEFKKLNQFAEKYKILDREFLYSRNIIEGKGNFENLILLSEKLRKLIISLNQFEVKYYSEKKVQLLKQSDDLVDSILLSIKKIKFSNRYKSIEKEIENLSFENSNFAKNAISIHEKILDFKNEIVNINLELSHYQKTTYDVMIKTLFQKLDLVLFNESSYSAKNFQVQINKILNSNQSSSNKNENLEKNKLQLVNRIKTLSSYQINDYPNITKTRGNFRKIIKLIENEIYNLSIASKIYNFLSILFFIIIGFFVFKHFSIMDKILNTFNHKLKTTKSYKYKNYTSNFEEIIRSEIQHSGHDFINHTVYRSEGYQSFPRQEYFIKKYGFFSKRLVAEILDINSGSLANDCDLDDGNVNGIFYQRAYSLISQNPRLLNKAKKILLKKMASEISRSPIPVEELCVLHTGLCMWESYLISTGSRNIASTYGGKTYRIIPRNDPLIFEVGKYCGETKDAAIIHISPNEYEIERIR